MEAHGAATDGRELKIRRERRVNGAEGGHSPDQREGSVLAINGFESSPKWQSSLGLTFKKFIN